MNETEQSELEALRREMRFNSLGDRPPSMAAHKLRRLIELEDLENETDSFERDIGFAGLAGVIMRKGNKR